jgi:hypothetical protein
VVRGTRGVQLHTRFCGLVADNCASPTCVLRLVAGEDGGDAGPVQLVAKPHRKFPGLHSVYSVSVLAKARVAECRGRDDTVPSEVFPAKTRAL